MDESTRLSIRQIFLNPRPFVALMTAAGLLGISFQALKRETAEGTIVAEATGMGVRVPRREEMAAAMRTWRHEAVEEALGEDAPQVLPRGDPAGGAGRARAAVSARYGVVFGGAGWDHDE